MEPISEETKIKLIKVGYVVKSGGDMFWALNPKGTSIVRGPLYNENDAWEVCERDYGWNLDKSE